MSYDPDYASSGDREALQDARERILELEARQPPMPLIKALHVLSAFHTRDDSLTGFVIEMHPRHPDMNLTPWSMSDYQQAWAAVRANIGLQSEPPEREPEVQQCSLTLL